jgi:hypothetical protein
MALGWREAAVAMSGLLTLASGFLPWWAVRVRDNDRFVTYAASAWRMSTRWTEAVVLTAVAAAAWLAWRLLRDRVPLIPWLITMAAVTVAVFLTLDQRDDVEDLSASPARTSVQVVLNPTPDPDPAGSLAAAWMQRDDLTAYRGEGLHADLSWGAWTGLTAMLLTGLSLAAAGPGTPRRPA